MYLTGFICKEISVCIIEGLAVIYFDVVILDLCNRKQKRPRFKLLKSLLR